MMKKNTFALTIVLILLMSLFLFFNVTAVREEALLVTEVSLAKEANQVSAEFSTWIRGEISMLETLKSVLQQIPLEEIKTPSQYNALLNISEQFIAPYIGFEDGTMLIGDRHNLLEDYDPRNRVWYQKALEQNQTTVSDVYLGAEYGRPMVTISSPLYMDNQFVGVIAADILISEMMYTLEESLDIPNSYIYVMTEEGMILLHTLREEWIGQSIHELSLENRETILTQILQSSDETIFYDLEGSDVMAVIRRIQSIDWVVGVAIDQQYIQREAGAYIRGITIVNFLFFIVMLLIVRNLYKLEKAVHQSNLSLRDKVYELHRAYDQIDAINQLLEEKSQRDDLTGIGNRGHFDQYLDEYWMMSLNEMKTISMIVFDVDNFKSYNDHYGHAMGDQALVEVANIVSNFIDEGIIFARIGGEEFAILGYNQRPKAFERLAEALRQSIEDSSIPHERSDHKVITVSMGLLETIATEEMTTGDFYHEADKMMYASKKNGRNRVTIG